MQKQIVLISGKARMGKDTFAYMASGYFNVRGIQSEVMHFSDKLKQVARNMGWDGKKDLRGRTLLQKLGTEVGREYDVDLWVKFIASKIEETHSTLIFLPDWRYPNEYSSLVDILESSKDHTYKFLTIRIRPSAEYQFQNDLTEEQKNHISETSLDGFDFDLSIFRNGDGKEGLVSVLDGIEKIQNYASWWEV